MAPKVMIVAGEPSGDLHASHVARQLKALCPDITLFGMGGDQMEAASVKLDLHIRDSAVMGFADVITVLPMFLRKQAYLKRRIREEHPDVLLLVDFAEFNMPLAKFARRQGVSVVYYIPPKAWAWRANRARKLAKWANVVAAIFPFEAEFYRNSGANAEFVGHPLVDFAQTPLSAQAARERLHICETADDLEAPVIGLMPGSRRSEIRHILPVMLKAAANIAQVYPKAHWILPLAPGISRDLIAKHQQELCRGWVTQPLQLPSIKIVENQTYQAMRASTLLLVTSGTATLEATCIGAPMIILFCTAAFNWHIIKALTPLNRSGLPNLIAGRDIVPELLQTELTPTALTALALDFLKHPQKRETQREALQAVYAQLGTAGAAERTAELVFLNIRQA
ncbi:lipid-A-disaccharide synthase [Candidatus Poribacteria bacterium]|nr:lipid-A-disaccharide synthase [Candidatus Poribacteria bacterium]MYH83885.1 lipid-A-disaccharide synthase [Candidatus Poribacteria bacterium]MYK93791.1 lipid-A-disaccharide synthase [Candidatus Poribacteria bacterium]